MKNLPPLVPDPVIEAYKKDVDRTLLRENLKLTMEERLKLMYEFMRAMDALRGDVGRRKRHAFHDVDFVSNGSHI